MARWTSDGRRTARRGEGGQASVELLGVLPVVAVLVLLAWQAAVAGQTVWLAMSAAREAARARALGHDPAAAARRVLPGSLRSRLDVRSDGDGVRVRLGVPLVFGTARLGRAGTFTARARMEPQA